MENQDRDGLKDLFADNAIGRLDEYDKSVDELFDYFHGEYLSCSDFRLRGVEGSPNHKQAQNVQYLKCSYSADIKTESGIYRFYIYSYLLDRYNEANNGIWSLFIKKTDDITDPYCASENYAYGIIIDDEEIMTAKAIEINGMTDEYVNQILDAFEATADKELLYYGFSKTEDDALGRLFTISSECEDPKQITTITAGKNIKSGGNSGKLDIKAKIVAVDKEYSFSIIRSNTYMSISSKSAEAKQPHSAQALHDSLDSIFLKEKPAPPK